MSSHEALSATLPIAFYVGADPIEMGSIFGPSLNDHKLIERPFLVARAETT
jgi:hypothetical protein